jgi:membrane-associated phospholipid phosphatase
MKPHGAAPFDRLLAVFNLLMAGAWLALVPRNTVAPWICAAHLAAASLPLLLESCSPGMRFVRYAYPIAWLSAFWAEVDVLRHVLHPYAHDTFIRALDAAIFGQSLHDTFIGTFPSLWVSEPLHFAYFAYYVAIGLPIVILALQKRFAAIDEAYLRLLLTYTICFSLYALFPVDGPQLAAPFFDGEPATGIWYRIVHAVCGVGASLGAAFPSSHAAGAVSIAYCGWLFFRRPVAVLMSVHAGLVVLATFYTQYHYAIDSLVGLVLALVLQRWVAPALLGRGRRRTMALPAWAHPACPTRKRGSHMSCSP